MMNTPSATLFSKFLLAAAGSMFCVACGGAPMNDEARLEAQHACLEGASAACHALVEDACAQGDSAACEELGTLGIARTTRAAASGGSEGASWAAHWTTNWDTGRTTINYTNGNI